MPPEARLRARYRLYLEAHLPSGYRWSAVEHGRKHSGTQEQRAREWGRLKAQGVAVGLMDLFITGPNRLFIWAELKAGKNSLSEAQDGWREHIEASGHRWLLGRSVVGLHNELVAAGVPVSWLAALDAVRHDDALLIETPPVKARASKPRAARPTAKAKKFAAKVYGL